MAPTVSAGMEEEAGTPVNLRIPDTGMGQHRQWQVQQQSLPRGTLVVGHLWQVWQSLYTGSRGYRATSTVTSGCGIKLIRGSSSWARKMHPLRQGGIWGYHSDWDCYWNLMDEGYKELALCLLNKADVYLECIGKVQSPVPVWIIRCILMGQGTYRNTCCHDEYHSVQNNKFSLSHITFECLAGHRCERKKPVGNYLNWILTPLYI